jgi:RHS repeat-associated protein
MLTTFSALSARAKRNRSGLLIPVLSAWLLCFASSPVAAQTYLENVGVPAFTTNIPVENGAINASNGNLHLEIPLGTFPQRGGRRDSVVLMYDSAIWAQGYTWSPSNITTAPGWALNAGGWRFVTSGDSGTVASGETDAGYCAYYDDYKTATYSPFIWSAPDGTQHSFPASTLEYLYPDKCNGTGRPSSSALASDGSGFFMSVTNYTTGTVYAPDGTVVGTAKVDTNGNQYTSTYSYSPTYDLQIFDSLHRKVLEVTRSTDGNTYYLAVPDAQGGTNTYTVKLGAVSVSTNFGQSGSLEFTGTINAVTEVDLPGTAGKYLLAYDSGTTAGHYGLLTSMTVPSGGQISYSWSNQTDANGKKYRWISSRTTPNGTWNYTFGVNSTCGTGQVNCQQHFQVTKPNADYDIYTFTLNGGAWPTKVQYYDDALTSALATTTQCFSFVTTTNGSCSYSVTTASPSTNVHLLAATTTLPVPSGNLNKTVEYTWDTNNYGTLTQIGEWAFNNPPTNAADRTTTISYTSSSSYSNYASYVAKNILNRPVTTTVTNSSGSTVSQTTNVYDGTALISGSVGTCPAVTGSANHDDTNYSSSNNVRGNLTEVFRNWSATNSMGTSGATFDITGQTRTTTDASGNQTVLCYSDNFYTDNGDGTNPVAGGNPTPATNAYPTTISSPIVNGSSLVTTYGYYFGTGQVAVMTDPNSEPTYSHFNDPLNRPTATLLPNSGWTRTAYNSSETEIDNYTGVTSSTATTSCTGTSGGCRRDESQLDGLGRSMSQILASDPDGQTSVDTTYDSNGRVHSVSNPHRSASSPTDGIEASVYDGLDRKTANVHADGNVAQTLYGASVALGGGLSSQVGSTSTYGYGYPILSIDETGKIKQRWIDGFGRTIETDEPAASLTSAPGTGTSTVSGTELNAGLGSVTISGVDQHKTYSCKCCGPQTDYDYGTVSITLNGIMVTYDYGNLTHGDTSSTVASGLATLINASNTFPGTAVASGAIVYITAKPLSGSTNYSLSAQAISDDTYEFPNGSFSTSPSGATLTTNYDSGTVSVTLNDYQASVPYAQSSTTSSVAAALAVFFNGDNSSPVTASASGGVLTLTAKAPDSNYALSSGSTSNQPAAFTTPSFTISVSGSNLTGGSSSGAFGATPSATLYTYDLNNNLTGVKSAATQNICNSTFSRCYSYDLMSRLVSKTDPETGTTSFSYLNAGTVCSGDIGAVCQRTAPKENQTSPSVTVTTTYTYDSVNRLTSKSYNDSSTPSILYGYDAVAPSGCTPPTLTIANGKGRRTSMCDGSGATAWSYDSVGNLLTEVRTTSGVSKTNSYTYNYDSSLKSITYPGGRTVNYAVGNAQRPTSAIDSADSIYFAQNATYVPPGGKQNTVYGGASGGSGGINELYMYNNRLQPCRISVRSSGSAPATCADSTYGNLLDLAFAYETNNAGNIATQVNNVDTTRGQSYTYDSLTRLLTAQSQASSGADCWGQGFNDDPLGNLSSITNTKCSSPSPSYGPNVHNEVTGTGYGYDAAGEATADGLNSYSYDAENRIVAAVTGAGTYCYLYDGDDMRVAKAQPVSGGTCTSTGSLAPAAFALYWRGESGDSLAQTDATGSTSNSNYHEYIFFAGRRIARSDVSAGSVYYYFVDQIGSTRVIAQANGTVSFKQEYYPYGQEVYTQSFDPGYKFTGYETDPETGLGYAFARYYNPRLGRFMTADPMGGDPSDPQTLNRYSYVRNNPINLIDPNGQCGLGFGFFVDPFDNGGDGGSGGGGGFSFGFPGGSCEDDGREGPQRPVYTPPDAGTDPDPTVEDGSAWKFGCEMNGIPCGMQFPAPGCTMSGGWNCGGVILSDGEGVYIDGKYTIVDTVLGSLPFNAPLMRSFGQCLGQSLVNNAVPLLFDGLGFIPGESQAGALFQIGLGIASATYSATQKDLPGFFGGIAGMHLTALHLGQAGKALPFIGYAINIGFTARDLTKTITDAAACAGI